MGHYATPFSLRRISPRCLLRQPAPRRLLPHEATSRRHFTFTPCLATPRRRLSVCFQVLRMALDCTLCRRAASFNAYRNITPPLTLD